MSQLGSSSILLYGGLDDLDGEQHVFFNDAFILNLGS
jgi:hypothetical protein